MKNKFSPAQRRKREAARRLRLLNRFIALRESGFTNNKATRRLGTSLASIYRWRKLLADGGLAGLAPRTGHAGPQPLIKKLRVTNAMLRTVQRLTCELRSRLKAWHAFAKSPQCPKRIAAAVLAHSANSVPHSFAQATRLHRSKVTLLQCGEFKSYLPSGSSAAAKPPQRRKV